MNRATLSDAKYRDLFGDRDASAPEDDPEFMTILRRLIFGEIFFIGDLDDQTRELITVVVLTTTQMLSQLKAHTGAALNVGVTPVEVREVVYQCAPFIGLPPTLNAIGVINEVFRSRGIDLPLPAQAAADEDERYDKGKAIQVPLYGDEIRNDLDDLPDELRDVVPRLLTEFCFGDFSPAPALTSCGANYSSCACSPHSAEPTLNSARTPSETSRSATPRRPRSPPSSTPCPTSASHGRSTPSASSDRSVTLPSPADSRSRTPEGPGSRRPWTIQNVASRPVQAQSAAAP